MPRNPVMTFFLPLSVLAWLLLAAAGALLVAWLVLRPVRARLHARLHRSEEHTSELQSH